MLLRGGGCVREVGKNRTGCNGWVCEVMLQRCDTESIALKGDREDGGMEGWREEGYMPNRKNHTKDEPYEGVRAQATTLHEKKEAHLEPS